MTTHEGLERAYQQIQNSFRGPWRVNESMALHTTWRIGGPADVLAIPEDDDDLAYLIKQCHHYDVPWTVIGAGSNVLVSDLGIEGIVIKLSKFCHKEWQNHQLIVGAGLSLPYLSRYSAKKGFKGLEFAVAIPASLGGSVVMNAGAHGQSMDLVVAWIDGIDEQGHSIHYDKAELDFSYRYSRLQKEKVLVTRIALDLQPYSIEALTATMEEVLQKRKATQPLQWPNAGSIFLNPPGQSAGRLIESAGMKGFTVGGAQVSTVHANFIINQGHAKAEDVLKIMEEIRQRVKTTCGIELESEVRVIGRTGEAG
ncbi:UDP-N-acetylmuramate dehydrogenase [Heliorestis acidaminivorans]|uniref:UDP-N-acetylenolpyruvoylglucosamine reductase n=1 Tax=Heliorestis acidaminivorans TaxID=553427 RepID=A0A6I0F6B9_9FIRM|nr:UDP-N-acetylmuramate dehydrogenase [Heliorestis acidaminivorans]KAB2954522.1 UDP-N-acetylmuramate dehydrogenase [Heliorestis acidaminivorans]